MILDLLLIAICFVIVLYIKLKGVSPLIKVFTFFVVSALLREGFIIAETNFELLERDAELSKWLTLVLYGLACNPVLISLVILSVWKSHAPITKKFLWLAGFVLFPTSIEGVLNRLAYIHFNRWNLYFSAIRYASVLAFTWIFLYWLDKKVIKI